MIPQSVNEIPPDVRIKPLQKIFTSDAELENRSPPQPLYLAS